MEHLGAGQTSLPLHVVAEAFHVVSMHGIVCASSQLGGLTAGKLFTGD